MGAALAASGRVIVSETAGVAHEVKGDAMLVSPLDVEGTATALARAIDMPESDRAARLARIRAGVLNRTSRHRLSAQLHELLPGDAEALLSGSA